MIRLTDRKQTFMIIGAVILVSPLIFTTLLVLIKPEFVSDPTLRATLMLLNLGLIMSLVMAVISARGLLVQFAQRLYSLSLEDAEGLVNRILYGLPAAPPFDPVLRVDRGRVDPDGPEVLRKVGGPGFLSVGHDSAAVVARGGTLVEILGPGFHHLDPFVKVWDVIDLRPQHRKVKVETNTRDGIPVYCDVEVRFRVDNGEDLPTRESPSPYPFTDTAKESVLKLTTTKVVLAPGGKTRYTDWTKRVPNGMVDGEVRDRIEQFRLDELLTANAQGKPLITTLEKEITNAVRENARPIGVRLEEVRLGPILPAEDAISQQWLETWRSEWDRVATKIKTEAAAEETERIELTRIHAQADLLTNIVQKMQSPNLNNYEIPPSFILLRFMDVIRSMADSDPMVRSTMFMQAESLQRILGSLGDTPQPPKEELPAPRRQG